MKLWSTIRIFFGRHRVLRIFSILILGIVCLVLLFGGVTFASLSVFCKPEQIVVKTQAPESVLPPGDRRPEVSTYLTYPEWFIVYSSDEYGKFLSHNAPSKFPYFTSIKEYWKSYCGVYAYTKARQEFSAGDHLMLFVIGWSYSVEFSAKGLYENTIGRITEQFGQYPATPEDTYGAKIAQDYVDFIRLRPWYEYNFFKAFTGVWTEADFFGPHFPRKVERKLFLSSEYLVKTVYGWLIGVASHSVYGVSSIDTHVIVKNLSEPLLGTHPEIRMITSLPDNKYHSVIPRYQTFTDLVPVLAREGVEFVEVAGNHEIFLTALIDQSAAYSPAEGQIVFQTPIPTDPTKKRIGLSVPIADLRQTLLELQASGAYIEHIYDY